MRTQLWTRQLIRAGSLLFAFTLTLAVSCGKRNPDDFFLQKSGLCNGAGFADFGLYISKSTSNPHFLTLKIVTTKSYTAGGQFVRVAMANGQSSYYEELAYTQLRDGAVLFNSDISPESLNLYDTIIIVPDSGQMGNLLDSKYEGQGAFCTLPSGTIPTGSAGY